MSIRCTTEEDKRGSWSQLDRQHMNKRGINKFLYNSVCFRTNYFILPFISYLVNLVLSFCIKITMNYSLWGTWTYSQPIITILAGKQLITSFINNCARLNRHYRNCGLLPAILFFSIGLWIFTIHNNFQCNYIYVNIFSFTKLNKNVTNILDFN